MRWPWTPRPPALTDSRRLDAESEALLRLTSSPSFQRHLDAVQRGLWGNAATGVGGATDPLSLTTVQGYQPLEDFALAQLAADAVAMRCCSEIPEALSAAGHVLTLPDAADVLRPLAAAIDMHESFREADRLSRHLRGAGLVIRCREAGNPPLSEPLDPDRVLRIIGLDIHDGFSLQPHSWQDGTERDHHPLFDPDARPGDPASYRLYPTGRTGGYKDPIHWTRVIPFWGMRQPPGVDSLLYSVTNWRALSILDLCYAALRRYATTQRSAEQITAITGVLVGEVPAFNALQTGKDAEGTSGGGWASAWKAMIARFRMAIGPPGTKLTPVAIPLGGWADMELGAQLALSGATRIPAVKLFSTPLPGLNSSPELQQDQWESVTRSDYTQRWKPGQARLYRLEHWRRFRRLPVGMMLARGPLKEPTPKEKMDLRLQGADEAARLKGAGIDISAAVLEGRYGEDGWSEDLPPVAPPVPEAPPVGPEQDAALLDAPEDLPTDTAAADFAAKLTEYSFETCRHGFKNRCPRCGVERVPVVEVGPNGEPVYPVRWRAIGARADALPANPLPLGPPPSPNRQPYPYAGSLSILGLPILVETAAGQTRSGVDPEGRPWSVTMPWHYGEIVGTMGLDGDPVDVMVGPNPSAPNVYIMHIRVPGTEQMEEDKAYLGFDSPEDALAAFRDAYTRRDLLSGYTRWHAADFARWVKAPENAGKRIDTPPGSGLSERE